MWGKTGVRGKTKAGTFNLVVVFSVLITGCGGGGSSDGQSVTGSYAPVPDTVTYREGGAVKGMQVFDYSAGNVIRSRFVVDPGNDGQWGTGDDVRAGGLTCRYQQSDNPLPPALLSVVQNMGTNGDGNFALQQLDIESDGRISVCPSREGKQLVKEEVLCKGDFCPASYQFGYRMTISQQAMEGGGWKQSQHVVFYGENDQITTAPPFLSHIQTTDLSGNSQAGFEFFVTVDPSPEYSDSVSLPNIAVYAGHGYQKKVAKWLPGDLESRVIIDRYGDNDSFVDTRYRTFTWLPEIGELHESEASRNPPAPNEYMKLYGFDENGKPDGDVSLGAGDDEIWFSKDDTVYGFPEFVYDENGQLLSMLDTQGNPEREFTYDGDKVKSIHVRDRKRREYQYSNGKLARISLFSRNAERVEIEQLVLFRNDIPGVSTFIPDRRFPRDKEGDFLDPLVPQDRNQIIRLGRPF
jgi:YD repeat-containing protein